MPLVKRVLPFVIVIVLAALIFTWLALLTQTMARANPPLMTDTGEFMVVDAIQEATFTASGWIRLLDIETGATCYLHDNNMACVLADSKE